MSALTFELKQRPGQRLDLTPLIPAKLAGLKPKEIEALSIGTTREKLTVGDAFKIKAGDTDKLRLIGTDGVCDRIGRGLTDGEIFIDGDAGAYLGASMQGGAIKVTGSAGVSAGASMNGGTIDIGGDTGDKAGGMNVGQSLGMAGGRIVVGGNAGDLIGDRMRRGLIIVGGRAGDYAGGRMIAGTIMIDGPVGRFAGFGLRRGSLILGEEPKHLLPTFGDSGVMDFNYLRLLGRQLAKAKISVTIGHRAQRLMGDMAVLGKGEMLILCR